MTDELREVLGKLKDVKRAGDGWMARCPAHDDRSPSLSVGVGSTGKLLLNCHAGCRFEAILDALDISWEPPDHRPEITYDYRDATGATVYQVVRMEPKSFRLRQPDGKGGWSWTIRGLTRVLYRLPELLASDPSATVYVVEGEKDADNVAGLGLTVTTIAGGSGGILPPDIAKHLTNREVVILPDHDEPGREFAQKIAKAITAFAQRVAILELPGLPPKGDVTDWLAMGGTREQLEALTAGCWPKVRVMEPVTVADWRTLMAHNAQPVTDAIPMPFHSWNRTCRDEGGGIGVAPGWFILLGGKPGTGKSVLALNIASVAMMAAVKTAYLSYEMSRNQLLTRLMAIASGCSVRKIERGQDYDAETFRQAIEVMEHHGLDRRLFMDPGRPARTLPLMVDLMRKTYEVHGCPLMIVDYLQLVGRSDHPQIFDQMRAVSESLTTAAADLNVTVVGLSQFKRAALDQRNESPGAEGLKGGSVDEDGDQVTLLDYSKANRDTPSSMTLDFILDKNRHGPQIRFPIRFDYQTLQAKELASMDTAMQKIREKKHATYRDERD